MKNMKIILTWLFIQTNFITIGCKSFHHFEEVNCDENEEMYMLDAVKVGNLSQIRYLMSCYPNKDPRDSNGNAPLHFAVLKGDIEMVKFLMKSVTTTKEPENRAGIRPIHIAAKFGYLNILKFFMDEVIGIDKEPKDERNGWRPIHYAAYTGINLDVVKYLMSVIQEKEPKAVKI
jgi:ankyrin repeat protein